MRDLFADIAIMADVDNAITLEAKKLGFVIDYLDRDWKRITCTPINSSICVIAEDRLLQ